MELYSLQVFLTIASEKSFSRAAEQIAAHAAGDLARAAAAGAGAGGEADRPVGQGPDSDRRRAHGAGLCAALPEPAAGDGQLAGGAARQFGGAADHRGERIHHALPAAAHRALPRVVPEGEGTGAAQPVEQDPQRAAGRQPGTGSDQLRSGRRAAEIEGDLHGCAGVRGVAEAPAGAAGRRYRLRSWRRRTSSRTMWSRRTATWCCASSSTHKVPLRMDVEMPTIETIRKMVQNNRAWRFCRACAWSRRSSRGCCAR